MRPKQKNNALHYLSDKQFKALIENAHEGILLYDLQGKIKYSSNSVNKIAGYTKTEVLHKTGTRFLHPDDVEEAARAFVTLLKKPGKSMTLFQRIRHKKGHYIWAESRLTNFLHIPEISGVVSNFRDITEKKRAEEKATKTQGLLETINRNLSEGIFMALVNKEFIYANEAFLNITGYKTFAELAKMKPAVIFSDEREQRKIFKSLKTNQTLRGVETVFKKKSGEVFWGVLNVSLVKHEGREDHFVGTVRDISKEKEAERQLIESRNFLDNIINTVAAPIFVKDERHRWVMFNEKFCSLLGKTKKQLAGKTDKDFLSKEEVRVFYKTDNEVLRTGKTSITEETLSAHGKTHHLLTVKARYVNEMGERFVIGFITEITHLKRAEEKIKYLHENLQSVLESSKESIFSVDQDLRYIAFNHRHKNIMKMLYNADIQVGAYKIEYLKSFADCKWVKTELVRALKGRHFVTEHYQEFPKYTGYIQSAYNPIRDDKNKVKGVAVFVQDITQRKSFEEIIKSINANLRAVMESTSDGILAIDRKYRCITFNRAYAAYVKKQYGVEITVGDNLLKSLPLNFSTLKPNCEKAFSGKQFTIETEGAASVILETSFNPIYDERGGVTGAALFIRDITARKRMEERFTQLNTELLEQNVQLAAQEEELKSALEELSERNFELDQLMYKTSHDLRSPLSSIMGLINVANLDPDPDMITQYLQKIDGRVKKLDEFICSMLDYARVNRVELATEEIDLKVMARNCIAELEYLENFNNMRTEICCPPIKLKYKSDRLRMKIIFSNIISNAYKYMNREVESMLKITFSSSRKQLSIKFEDNGIGIKDEYINKIFNMFYRATDRSQGSGLGMYIVKQAVEKLNGKIRLESEYGKGTTIEITLPPALSNGK